MSKMRGESRSPMEILQPYKDAGTEPPPDKMVESLLGTIRMNTMNVLYYNSRAVEFALTQIYDGLSPEEWIENGLWQDVLDHVSLNCQTMAMVQLLSNRMTTDQVWILDKELDEGHTFVGVGFPVWTERQLASLPVGCVVRWKDEYGYKVAVQGSPGTWQSPGYTKNVEPELPVTIIAGPGDDDEFDSLQSVGKARKILGAEDDE